MDATSAVQASISAFLTATSPESQSIFGLNPFDFWSIVIGTFSTVFGTIIAVLVFVLGLQVWQQYKWREKAEKEYEAILRIKDIIAKTANEMSELKSEQQKLFKEISENVQKQTKELVEEATNVTSTIKSFASISEGEKEKIERISKEIERKGDSLRGSAISLGTISGIGTFSPSVSPSASEYDFLKFSPSPSPSSEYVIGEKAPK